MTNFTAEQLRAIINLSNDRYLEHRTHDGIEAETTLRMLDLYHTALVMLREATARPKYEYINTGRQVKLGDLAISDDITDDTTIKVFGVNGNFLARGKWYMDDVMEWSQAVGTVTLAGANPDYLTVHFRISEPENSRRISVDNGATWISPVEALSFIRLEVMVEYMEMDTMEAVNRDLAHCSDLDYLTEYLRRAKADLVIG